MKISKSVNVGTPVAPSRAGEYWGKIANQSLYKPNWLMFMIICFHSEPIRPSATWGAPVAHYLEPTIIVPLSRRPHTRDTSMEIFNSWDEFIKRWSIREVLTAGEYYARFNSNHEEKYS